MAEKVNYILNMHIFTDPNIIKQYIRYISFNLYVTPLAM